MPQRSARVTITNTSSYLRLVRTADHLCGGDWTPGGWDPPDAIEPGETRGMQSEDGGSIPLIGNLFTGTDGYAKFDAIGPDRRHGMIYVYWDNPWWGVTHVKFESNADDVPPDCDFATPDGGSAFSSDASLDFSLVPIGYRHTDGGSDITSAGDLAAAVATGPLSLIGDEGIVKDPEWIFELRDVTPAFAAQQPETTKLLSDATPADWVGEWRSADIDVAVTRHGANSLTADITLHQGGQPTRVQFDIGPESALNGRLAPASSSAVTASPAITASPAQASLIRETSRRLLTDPVTMQHPARAAERFDTLASTAGGERPTPGGSGRPLPAGTGALIGQVIADSQSTVHVDGFVLSLYGIYDGSARVSKSLRLQRVVDGTPDIDATLQEYVELR